MILIIRSEPCAGIDSFNPGNSPESGTTVPISDEETKAPGSFAQGHLAKWRQSQAGNPGSLVPGLCFYLYYVSCTFSEPGCWDVSPRACDGSLPKREWGHIKAGHQRSEL